VVELPVADIVAGDVILLAAGDLVSADGIALAVNGAQVNEPLLTGEPYPVEKQVDPATTATIPAEARNTLFHGTSPIGGTATMLSAMLFGWRSADRLRIVMAPRSDGISVAELLATRRKCRRRQGTGL
jgi:magnesium-transporting ATPase (P-type)